MNFGEHYYGAQFGSMLYQVPCYKRDL